MESFEGTVILVQESRFMVQSPVGDHKLFVLSHRSGAEPAQLAPLQRAQARVRVRYEPAPDLVANLAHDILLLDGAKDPPA